MQKNLTEYTDQELLDEAAKLRSVSITDAFFVGFLIGIVIFSIAQSAWGVFTLIPLYLIYKLINKPKDTRKAELDALIQQRGLK